MIELLIVVAIIGIVAAILIPNLLDSLNKAKQKRTVGDIRSVGGAWFNWLTDQVGAAAAGQATYDFTFGSAISADELQSILSPSDTMFYLQTVPEHDAWAHDYEYRLSTDFALSPSIGIRSQGRDAAFEADAYTPGPFLATLYDSDVVWADGYFIRYPAGASLQ